MIQMIWEFQRQRNRKESMSGSKMDVAIEDRKKRGEEREETKVTT